MEIKNIRVIYNINRKHPPERITVTHVNDVNTRTVELELRQGDEPVEITSDYTVKAAIVERKTKILINDNIPCTLNDTGNILIPIDNLHYRNKMDINVEVSITGITNGHVLTLPYPLWIRVNPSILDNAEISDESLGTVPELLEEAQELIENYHYILSEEDIEQISEALNINDKESVSNKIGSITDGSEALIYYDSEGVMHTRDPLVVYPNYQAVKNYVLDKVTEINQDIESMPNYSDIPSNVSDLNNDSGFLTLSTLPKYNGGVQ